MMVALGPEGSGHHLLEDIFREHKCHGHFFVSLPSGRYTMDPEIGKKVNVNARVGTYVSLDFIDKCNPTQILLLHREPYGCIHSTWARFGGKKPELIPTFVNYHMMAIAMQKVVALTYPEDTAIWDFDNFVAEYLGTEFDGVHIQKDCTAKGCRIY